MGTYYRCKEVERVGQRVSWDSYNGVQPQIPAGKRLIAIMDRLLYKAAPDVTDPNEFKHFFDQYAEGQFVGMLLYLVGEDQLEHD